MSGQRYAPICQICDDGFTEDEWEDRHSDDDGEDIHSRCCDSEGPCSSENERHHH